jgi:chromate reductase
MFGAVWAQADLRRVLQTIGAKVVDRELPVMQVDKRFGTDGRLVDIELRDSIAAHVNALLDAAREPELAAAA